MIEDFANREPAVGLVCAATRSAVDFRHPVNRSDENTPDQLFQHNVKPSQTIFSAVLSQLTAGVCLLLPMVRGDDAVIDFRTFIPGVVDAPVYRADGTNRLTGLYYFAQLYFGPNENSLVSLTNPAVFFGTNEWAGYCWTGDQSAPVPVIIPLAKPGDRVWFMLRAWEPSRQFRIPEIRVPDRLEGYSERFSLIVSNTPTPLIGLKSFSLQPAFVQITRANNNVVLRWSAGDETVFYEVEVASTLGGLEGWRSYGASPKLERQVFEWSRRSDWVLTNSLTGPGTFFRVRLLNP